MLRKLILLSLMLFKSSQSELTFSQFIKQYDKSYADDELINRFNIYTNNIAEIQNHNSNPDRTWSKGINQFSDLTPEEFKTQISRPISVSNFNYSMTRNLRGIPTEWDWTTQGAVTAVKDQGKCGSCWAFSAAEAIESAWFIKNKALNVLSEQQIIECDKVDSGCNGGEVNSAFDYIIKNKGLCSEASYPYKGKEKKCKPCNPVANIVSYINVNATENALLEAVYKQPISVAIEADQNIFQSYSSGVLTATCGTNLDHAVVLVGYGTLNGQPYWKVRNSWGSSWGMSGYILLARNVSQPGGQCGILLSASYPVV